MTQVTVNGHTYSDDGTVARDMLNGGAKTWQLPMIVDTMVEVAATSVAKTAAEAAATAAATSAAAAASVLSGTSATSVLMGTGSKTFVTQAGKQFAPGTYLRIQRAADAAIYMYGRSTAYDATDGNPLTVSVERIQGAGTFTDWQIFATAREGDVGPAGIMAVGRRAISSNDSVTSADAMKILSLSGTFTLTLDAPGVLGANFAFFTSNDGTGEITIPASDGRTNWKIYPGEKRLWQSDGTTTRSIVLSPFYLEMTASGNFIKPPGYLRFGGRMWGAGASGLRSSTASVNRSGGGGGSAPPLEIRAADLADSTPFVCGAGGAARTVDAAGENGGNSTFAGFTAEGGQGAPAVNTNGRGGSAYLPGSSNEAISSTQPSVGKDALYGGATSNQTSTTTYKTVWGGGAGGGIASNDVTLMDVVATQKGGPGGVASIAGVAGSGTAPGGGGGATKSGTSGAGARGELRLWGEA